ncbi:MAG TPA: TlpA family protein disulfide reductase [Clostridiales bacterium]|nr:MAG: alkyl hydroperoxide reductase [Clostridiales bacterium GWD2_32_59]HAN10687.1 TlpA family protein disulfide reductase [Clostridiales bacterium]
MKTSIIIWSLAIVLLATAIYITNNYNENKSNNPTNVESTNSTSSNNEAPVTTKKSIATQAIDFTLEDLNGNKVSLSDYKGQKNVFLNFWATWCPPCRLEMPEIEKIYQAYKDKDLAIITVNLGEDKNTVYEFINNNNYSFNVLLDREQSVAELYNITSIPVSYFIDKEGNIQDKRIGAMTEDQMKTYIDNLNNK